MQIVNAKRNVNKHLPHEVFNEGLAMLLLDVSAEVSMLTVLHDDVDLRVFNKTVVVAYNEVTVYQTGK